MRVFVRSAFFVITFGPLTAFCNPCEWLINPDRSVYYYDNNGDRVYPDGGYVDREGDRIVDMERNHREHIWEQEGTSLWDWHY